MMIPFAFRIDALSLTMMLIVTGIGTLIHLYSIGYMHEDRARTFFAQLNLFSFAMLMLVMGSNLLITFIGWEGVGLCSYLLIGFWYTNPDYNYAARKAFVMNRIGDVGMVLAMVLLFQRFGTLEYAASWNMATGGTGTTDDGRRHPAALRRRHGQERAASALHLAARCHGRSHAGERADPRRHDGHGRHLPDRAQLSALRTGTVHAGRDPLVGTATALLAASIGLFQNDIKKVLAYSTVSQLGYMFAALGMGAYSAAMFHVTTHAFFKALLFLGAGSVIHALGGEQDIRKMGGLKGTSRSPTSPSSSARSPSRAFRCSAASSART
jgi:NADH-quinone oxidoreductase subunit L